MANIGIKEMVSACIGDKQAKKVMIGEDVVWDSEPIDNTPLTFTAVEAGVEVYMEGSVSVALDYSTDGTNWSNYTIGDHITLTNIGDSVMFKATTTNTTFATRSGTTLTYNRFMFTGKATMSGRLTSLLNGDSNVFAKMTDITRADCFNRLFYKNKYLVGDIDLSYIRVVGDGVFAETFSLDGVSDTTGYGITSCDLSGIKKIGSSCYQGQDYSRATPPSSFYATFDSQVNMTTLDMSGFVNDQVPDDTAGSLGNICYNCQSLTTVKLQNLRKLYQNGLWYAFYNCSSLAEIDFSRLERVYDGTWNNTFNGCSTLRTVKLNKLSFSKCGSNDKQTFVGCVAVTLIDLSEIETVPRGFVSNFALEALSSNNLQVKIAYWLYDAALTFVPSTINSKFVQCERTPYPGLTLTTLEANNTVSMTLWASSSGAMTSPNLALEYSLDDGDTWATFIGPTDGTSVNVVLANVGDKVCFRGTGVSGNQAVVTVDKKHKYSADRYKSFSTTGRFNLSGNIASVGIPSSPTTAMVDWSDVTLANYNYYKLFQGTKVVDASGLKMKFSGCASSNNYGLQQMFSGCSQMEYGPELLFRTWPTGNTAGYLFYGCDNLKSFKFDMIGASWTVGAFSGRQPNGVVVTFESWSNFNGYYVEQLLPRGGTMYYNGTYREYGVSGIPYGWAVKKFVNGGI